MAFPPEDHEFQAIDTAEAEARREQLRTRAADYEDEDHVRVPIPDEPILPADRAARSFDDDPPEGVRVLPIPRDLDDGPPEGFREVPPPAEACTETRKLARPLPLSAPCSPDICGR